MLSASRALTLQGIWPHSTQAVNFRHSLCFRELTQQWSNENELINSLEMVLSVESCTLSSTIYDLHFRLQQVYLASHSIVMNNTWLSSKLRNQARHNFDTRAHKFTNLKCLTFLNLYLLETFKCVFHKGEADSRL